MSRSVSFKRKEAQKEEMLIETINALKNGLTHPRVYWISSSIFNKLPGSVYAYWVPEYVAQLFSNFPPLDRDHARKLTERKLTNVKVGLQTGDNPRYVRFFWEIQAELIASNADQTREGRPWCWYGMGGWLSSFQTDIDNVVYWEDDGESIRSYPGSVVRNEGYYFRQSISWHHSPQYPSNQRRMNARYFPSSSIFTVAVNCIFPEEIDLWESLGYLNSAFVFYLIRIFELRHILATAVGQLPYPNSQNLQHLGELSRAAYELKFFKRLMDELSPFCVEPALRLVTSRASVHFGQSG